MSRKLWCDDSVVSYPALIETLEGTLLVGFEACKIACDSTNAVHLRRRFNSLTLYYGRSWEGNRQRRIWDGGTNHFDEPRLEV